MGKKLERKDLHLNAKGQMHQTFKTAYGNLDNR